MGGQPEPIEHRSRLLGSSLCLRMRGLFTLWLVRRDMTLRCRRGDLGTRRWWLRRTRPQHEVFDSYPL